MITADIQEILDKESFLRPEQMIGYVSDIFTGQENTDDFYNLIIGVHGKKCCPLSDKEFERHERGLEHDHILLAYPDKLKRYITINYDLSIEGPNVRFYMNARDAESSRNIMRKFVRENKDRKFKLKTIGKDMRGFSRFDNTILYVNEDDAGSYVQFMKYLSERYSVWFDEEVPLSTRKIGKGIGYASSPHRCRHMFIEQKVYETMNMSLNELHSVVLKATLRASISKEDLVEKYKVNLGDAFFNPEKPYLKIRTWDIC